MLGNLIDKINKTKIQSLKIIKNLPVIELSDDDCRDFVDFIRRTLNVNSICNSHSFQVETSPDHWAVCSNQYLALAAVAYDLALCLKKYFDFFDLKIRPNEWESKLIIKLQNEFKNSAIQDISKIDKWLRKNKSKAYILHCNDNPNDQDSLCYFLAGIDSKKFGNEKGVLRGTQDLFGAYILSTEPVTTAASGFLGGLVFALAQEPSFYKRISDIFKNSSQRPLLETNDKEHSSFVSRPSSNFTPTQVIYYGVPGCGKSHTINEKLKNVADYNKIRTVFHPEYTNADFIGQILPEVNVDTNGHSVVEYKFNPGPFTEIVRRAYQNPDEEFFLVIEEINRGNAAAIFGDMFQLLDRLDADEKPEEVSSEHIYGAGWSSYGVDNPDINAYIRNQIVLSQEKPKHCSKAKGSEADANPRLYKSVDIESDNLKVIWKEKNGNDFVPKPKHLHFSANTAIRLPPNLSIYATMNTSDQNVFTLDNAFQRRWDMELVPNACNWNDEDHKKQAQSPIGDTDIRWETFRNAVNSEISGGDFFNADDKQLGLFFIEADGEKIDQKKFANKVLKYLWADVFKRDTRKIFKSENLSKVVEDFTGADAFDKVFTIEFAQSLKDTNDAIKNR